MRISFKAIVTFILDLLFPPKCVLCQQLLTESGCRICKACEAEVNVFSHKPWKIPSVKQWTALWQYSGVVRESLVRYKFSNCRNYSSVYAEGLAKKLRQGDLKWDVMTWVPVSGLRLWERGYDQVKLLAQDVGKILDEKPIKLLHKCRHNRRQSRLKGLKARQRNVQGAYKAVNEEYIKGKRILLLEDIVTTGSTVSECARTLKVAGAKEVIVACVAVASKYN